MTSDIAAYTANAMPKWNPMNICSYHLQEAGATPEQELAYALATAIAVLDDLRPKALAQDFPAMVGRISFFVNAGIRFITELCKIRAFAEMWDNLCHDRYNVTDAQHRRFRYGVQVNSLGLTEQQPENNMARILMEMLAVTLSKTARARAVQLAAWNEALGLPRPWDQQWSPRLQQILAYETNQLKYPNLFDGNPAIAAKVDALKTAALEELHQINAMGSAVAAIPHMKSRLAEANSARLNRIETGAQVVVGVNRYIEAEPSPLTNGIATMAADPLLRPTRSPAFTTGALPATVWPSTAPLQPCVKPPFTAKTTCPPFITAAKAGATTGEWGAAIRSAFGEYRALTGVSPAPCNRTEGLDPIRTAFGAV